MVSPDLNAGPGMLGYVVLMDPVTKQPYTAQNIVQQTDKEISTAGLATTEKQDEQLAILQSLAENATAARPVEIQNPEMPLPAGAATETKQDQIIAGLSSLATSLGGTLTVTPSGTLAISAASLPLPAGAATASGQTDIVTSLNALLDLITDGIEVVGQVTVPDGVDIRGAVTIANTSLAVTPSGTFAVTMAGSATESKQDQILTALGSVLTAIQAPQPITDNGGSVTVDGAVGISGPVAIVDDGGSITVDGTVAATQSGPWNVGITGTPTVNVGNTVTISDGSGPLTVDGTVGVSGTVTVATHAVTQSGTWNVTNTAANAATLTTTPTAISVGTASVSLAASVAGRKSVIIQNMGGTTLFLSFAATAVATAPTFQVPANSWIVIDRETWTGAITGIRASGSATADAVVTVTS